LTFGVPKGNYKHPLQVDWGRECQVAANMRGTSRSKLLEKYSFVGKGYFLTPRVPRGNYGHPIQVDRGRECQYILT
jgi:hypothetical protein